MCTPPSALASVIASALWQAKSPSKFLQVEMPPLMCTGKSCPIFLGTWYWTPYAYFIGTGETSSTCFPGNTGSGHRPKQASSTSSNSWWWHTVIFSGFWRSGGQGHLPDKSSRFQHPTAVTAIIVPQERPITNPSQYQTLLSPLKSIKHRQILGVPHTSIGMKYNHHHIFLPPPTMVVQLIQLIDHTLPPRGCHN